MYEQGNAPFLIVVYGTELEAGSLAKSLPSPSCQSSASLPGPGFGSLNHSKRITGVWHRRHFYFSQFLTTPTTNIHSPAPQFLLSHMNQSSDPWGWMFLSSNRKIPLIPPAKVWSVFFTSHPTASHVISTLKYPGREPQLQLWASWRLSACAAGFPISSPPTHTRTRSQACHSVGHRRYTWVSSASSVHGAGKGPLGPMEFAHLLVRPCSGTRYFCWLLWTARTTRANMYPTPGPTWLILGTTLRSIYYSHSAKSKWRHTFYAFIFCQIKKSVPSLRICAGHCILAPNKNQEEESVQHRDAAWRHGISSTTIIL